MYRLFPLKIKLTFYTLFFIVASTVLMGIISDNYLHHYFQNSAKKELRESFFDLSMQMKIIEKELTSSLYAIADNEAIIASLNLIKNYEDIDNYNPLIFDEEKKRIVDTLAREGRYSENDHIAVYDHKFRLVAFVDREEEDSYQGYVSYENGKPVYYIRHHDFGIFEPSSPTEHTVAELPMVQRIGAYEMQTGGIVYTKMHGKLHLASNRTILRKQLQDKATVVGYIQSSSVISRIELDTLVDKDELFLDYYFLDELADNAASEFGFLFNLDEFDNAPLLFSTFNADELNLGESRYIFYSGVKVPLQDGALLVTAQIDKQELHTALKESRILLIITLLLIVLITTLISLVVLNRMITVPLQRLLDGIKIITTGDYSNEIKVKGNDELTIISEAFNEMAEKVSSRENQLDELAHHDILTKLPNRVMFQEQLDVAIARAKRTDSRLAVFFLDLDEFKNINDTMGHDVGDLLLVEVAHNLQDTMRKDDLLARIGGDEFNILVENLSSPVYAEEVATKMIDVMKRPLYIGEEQLNITGSIGITIYPDDGEDALTLLKNADLAMYHAKSVGRNRYHFFSEELETTLKNRTVMLKELKNALVNEELMLYYQPKFSLVDGKICGVEALIRWKNKKLGFITPDEFIPLAEESGEIVEIGAWVVKQACSDYVEWKKQGIAPEQISVNVSNVQFADGNVIEVLQEAIESSGIEPHELEVEMTESYIHDNSEEALHVLQSIRQLGIDLAIDDFGTGYSSMSYLKRLPLSRLKIDKSFIEDIPHDYDDTEITKVIVALAKVMELSITAEGVETLEQMHFLKQLECDEGQGYLCSKPLPYRQFVALLEKKFSCTAHMDD